MAVRMISCRNIITNRRDVRTHAGARNNGQQREEVSSDGLLEYRRRRRRDIAAAQLTRERQRRHDSPIVAHRIQSAATIEALINGIENGAISNNGAGTQL